jgi:hypothetical protein
LRYVVRHDDLGFCIDGGLGVVSLHEPVLALHNPALGIGEVLLGLAIGLGRGRGGFASAFPAPLGVSLLLRLGRRLELGFGRCLRLRLQFGFGLADPPGTPLLVGDPVVPSLFVPVDRNGAIVTATKILWNQIVVVFAIVLATTWAATEWMAWRLSFQPQLAPPLVRCRGGAGLCAAGLLQVVGSLRRLCAGDLHRWDAIAASSGRVAIAVIGMSMWRAREAKEATTYGSAHWTRLQRSRSRPLPRPVSDSSTRAPRSLAAVLSTHKSTSLTGHTTKCPAGCFRLLPRLMPHRRGSNNNTSKYLKSLVPQEGFEPPTPALRMRCSTS